MTSVLQNLRLFSSCGNICKQGDKKAGSPEFKSTNLGSSKSKLEGVDKSAKKAMKGQMQKGGRKNSKIDVDSHSGKVVKEDGEDKVVHE